jgi:hypothetical protein
MEDGQTKEEWKMMVETKKILDPSIKVTATCVRVPVFVGHSEAVNIEFEEFLDEDEARDILREAPGCLVIDKREPGGYVTPIECVGDYATFISRIRQDGPWRTASTCGSSATTSARAPRSTPCRSPRCWGRGLLRRAERRASARGREAGPNRGPPLSLRDVRRGRSTGPIPGPTHPLHLSAAPNSEACRRGLVLARAR